MKSRHEMSIQTSPAIVYDDSSYTRSLKRKFSKKNNIKTGQEIAVIRLRLKKCFFIWIQKLLIKNEMEEISFNFSSEAEPMFSSTDHSQEESDSFELSLSHHSDLDFGFKTHSLCEQSYSSDHECDTAPLHNVLEQTFFNKRSDSQEYNFDSSQSHELDDSYSSSYHRIPTRFQHIQDEIDFPLSSESTKERFEIKNSDYLAQEIDSESISSAIISSESYERNKNGNNTDYPLGKNWNRPIIKSVRIIHNHNLQLMDPSTRSNDFLEDNGISSSRLFDIIMESNNG